MRSEALLSPLNSSFPLSVPLFYYILYCFFFYLHTSFCPTFHIVYYLMSGFSTDSLSALVLISIVLFALQRLLFLSCLLPVYHAWLFEGIPFFSPSVMTKISPSVLGHTYIPFSFFFFSLPFYLIMWR